MAASPAFVYNDTDFRAQFPAFANTGTYPEPLLAQYFATSGLYVANSNYGWLAAAGATLTALYLLTAHLAQIGTLIAAGQTPSIMSGATIDKISVTLEPPQAPNAWQWWLQTTPYGSQLLAMVQVQSSGGFYSPGGLGRAGFRAAYPGLWGRC